MRNETATIREIIQLFKLAFWLIRGAITWIYEIAVAVTRPLMNNMLLRYPLLTEQQFLLGCIGSWAMMPPVLIWGITLGQVAFGNLVFFLLAGGALGWCVGNRLVQEWIPLPPLPPDPTKNWGVPRQALEVEPIEETTPPDEVSQAGLLLGKHVPHSRHGREL